MRSILCLIVVLGLVACGERKEGADTSADTLEETAPDVEEEEVVDVVEEDGTGALWLEVGDVADLDGSDGAFSVTLEAPSDGGSYILVVFPSHWDFGGRYSYAAEVTGGGGGTGGSPPAHEEALEPVLPPLPGHAPGVDWGLLLEELAGRSFPAWETYPPDDPPTVGEVRQFRIRDGTGTVQTVDAECQSVTSEIAVWFDMTSTPTPAVSDLAEISRLYGDIVMPRERIFFGEESDYNEDGIVHVLFSAIVAEVATAYFSPCDLLEDPESFLGCDFGNHAEMVYVSPPELLDPHMSTPMAISETLAHETGHMIYFHRKFLMHDQPGANENIYLNEAIAAMAQDLTGMTGGNFFVMSAALTDIELFRGIDILAAGGGYSVDRDGALRGGAYLFLRYLYDQNGGETVLTDGSFTDDGSIAWMNTYFGSAELGEENIEATMDGRDVYEILFDWYTCMAMSNRGADSAPISADPRFNYLPTQLDPLTDRTRGADMFGTFRTMTLSGPSTARVDFNDGEVYSTGVQYLTFDASDVVEVSLTIDAEALAWVRLGRLE